MPEVGVIDAHAEYFINDRREVGKRADHAQRRRIRCRDEISVRVRATGNRARTLSIESFKRNEYRYI